MFLQSLSFVAFLAVAVQCSDEGDWAGLVLTRDAAPNKPIPLRTVDIDLQIKAWAVGCKATLTYRLGDREAPSNNVEFIFPTDTEAAVYHLELQQGDRRVTGQVMERTQAEQTYNITVASGQQAALLASHGSSADVYRLALGRVRPGEEIKVIIGYAAPIDRDENGTLQYILPMVFNPRGVSNDILRNPARAKSHLLPDSIWIAAQPLSVTYNISIRGTVDVGQTGVTLTAIETMHSDHVLSITRITDEASNFSLTNFRNNHDFGIRIKVSNPLEAGLFVENGVSRTDGTAFNEAIIAGVWLDHQVARAVTTRTDFRDEYWFVIDQSRSMLNTSNDPSTTKFDQARSAMNIFLRALPETAYFNILGFGGLECREEVWSAYNNIVPRIDKKERYCDRPADQRKGYVYLSEMPLDNTDDSFRKAHEYISNVRADVWGDSLILPALEYIYSVTAKVEPPNRRYIFLITDGAVANYDEIMALARRNKETARVFSVGIGDGASTMLKRIALQTGGAFEAVREGSDDRLQEKISRLMGYANGISVDDLQITWTVDDHATLKRTIPGPNLTSTSALHGRETLQFAVLNRENDADSFTANVAIRGSSDGVQLEEINFNADIVPFMLASESDLMPLHRLAAKQRLNDLVDLYRDGNDEKIKSEAIAFSIETGVVCEFTALLAVDDEGGKRLIIQPKRKTSPPTNINSILQPRFGGGATIAPPVRSTTPAVTAKKLDALIALQRFNGSWSLTRELVERIASPNATNTTSFAAVIRRSVTTAGPARQTGLIWPTEASGHRDDSIATVAVLAVMRVTFSHRAMETRFADGKAVDYLRKVAGNPTDQGLERIVKAISNHLTL